VPETLKNKNCFFSTPFYETFKKMDTRAVGSDAVSDEESPFVSVELLGLQPDLKDQSQNRLCMGSDECQPEREHSEISSNGMVVDIQSHPPSAGSQFLAQPSNAVVAVCELNSDVLTRDSLAAELNTRRDELQNNSSDSVVTSFVSQECGDGCSYGKRVSESMESCLPASKRLKCSQDFEVSDLVTTEIQYGLSDKVSAVDEVENGDQSKRVADVRCPIEGPLTSVVGINPTTNETQMVDLKMPLEPLTSVFGVYPSTNDIQADDFNKPLEPLASVVETKPTNDIQADDFNKPHEPLPPVVEMKPSINDIQVVDSNKPQEPLSSVVETKPSTNDIQAGDFNKLLEPLSSVVGIKPSTNVILMEDINKPQEPLPSVVEMKPSVNVILMDYFNKPQEPLPPVVEMKPSINVIQAEDFNKPPEPHTSVVEIMPSTNVIQMVDFRTPQEPLTSVVEMKPSINLIQVLDFNKPQEPLPSVVGMDPSTNVIQAEDFNKPQEPLPSVVEMKPSTNAIWADDFNKPQESLPSVVEMKPSTNDIQVVDFNKPQEPFPPVVEIIPSTNVIQVHDFNKLQEPVPAVVEMNPSTNVIQAEDFHKPEVPLISVVDIKPSSNVIWADDFNKPQEPLSSVKPSTNDILVDDFKTDDHCDEVTEGISDSVALAENKSELLPQPKGNPLDIILAESDIRNEDPEFSHAGVIAGEKSLSPFELSMVIDNLIRRELEASHSSHCSEDTSDDDDLGDEDLQSGEKMDVDDEVSCVVSKSSSKVIETGETAAADHNLIPCEVLMQEKAESTKFASDSKAGESVADEAQGVDMHQTDLNIDSDKDRVSSEACVKTEISVEVKTEVSVKALDVDRGQLELLASDKQSTDIVTLVKGSNVVSSTDGEFGSGVNLVSEARGDLMQESSIKEDLPQNTGEITTKNGELLAGGDSECSQIVKQNPGTETALKCGGEPLVAGVSASTTEEVAKKLYDPFEDMDVVDEDAATDEDGPAGSNEAHDQTKADNNCSSNARGARRGKGSTGQGSNSRKNEDNQRRTRFAPAQEDQTHGPGDEHWPKEEQARWPNQDQAQWSSHDQGQWPNQDQSQWLNQDQAQWPSQDQAQWHSQDQASWSNQNSEGEMHSDGRMPSSVQPIPSPANYRPSSYDPSSSGNMPSYGMPPASNMPQPRVWPAQGCMPPGGYMPPYPGAMQQPGGYGMPMPYSGMNFPPYFGQWGQWPAAGPAYPMVQQQQQQQQQQGQSFQDWQNWWQSYSAWYSSYMSGWNQQPAPQQMADISHYQSQGSWSSANQQYNPPPPTSEAPPTPQPRLPSAKQSAKNIPPVAKTDVASSNPKVSYRPTVTKGPILNPTGSGISPSLGPRLKFSISGPVPSVPVATKSALPSESLSAGKDAAAGELIFGFLCCAYCIDETVVELRFIVL